ncbi:hypothetical protein OsI_09928 [Oryza sativa Indica Group]|uniref:Cyclin-dependent kinase inhibitor domain-containing protein n=1 Tax=Oryza sativa subsp. indica TaxID=39946 RepID=A2XCA1_ORYSI|nr:hypothetical protein OsI_09928 [Oryza sativa Indica Group]
MGKYMRKGKVSGEVAVMEVGGALLGVRTRSRTLALQRTTSSQKPPEKGEGDPGAGAGAGAEYLELRSRRLEKPPPAHAAGQGEGDRQEGFRRRREDAGGAASGPRSSRRRSRCPSATTFLTSTATPWRVGTLAFENVCLQCSRSTRETTPCSLIRSSEMISTPGSTTKTNTSMSSRRRMETSVCRYVPSSLEMEEFFAAAEQQQHQAFRERYNFCPVNDCPLPGRYEWTRLDC